LIFFDILKLLCCSLPVGRQGCRLAFIPPKNPNLDNITTKMMTDKFLQEILLFLPPLQKNVQSLHTSATTCSACGIVLAELLFYASDSAKTKRCRLLPAE